MVNFSFANQGDVLNLVVVVNTVVYLGFFLHAQAVPVKNTAMDAVVVEDGFCVSNPTSPIWNSHMLSFYSDTIFTVILYLIATNNKKTPAQQYVQRNIGGVFFHGLGHFYISRRMFEASTPDQGEGDFPLFYYLAPVLLFGFWYMLLGASEFLPKSHNIFHSLWNTAVLLALPGAAGFTYVQTMLVLIYNIYETFYREQSTKTGSYNYLGMVAVPFSILAWVEGITCVTFLKNLGGHVWYDTSIPIAVIAFYYFTRNMDKASATAKKTQ